MKRTSLLVWVCRLGFRLGVGLVVVAGLVGRPVTATAQMAPDGMTANIVPMPGAVSQAARNRGPVPCEQVISRLDRNRRFEKNPVENQKERAATVKMIAKKEGTTRMWVVHCMRTYGRRVPAVFEGFENEDELADFEDDEPEESAPEDVGEPGAHERDTIGDENFEDRQRLRAEDPSRVMKETQSLPKEQVDPY